MCHVMGCNVNSKERRPTRGLSMAESDDDARDGACSCGEWERMQQVCRHVQVQYRISRAKMYALVYATSTTRS
jgi:hypothetical protein